MKFRLSILAMFLPVLIGCENDLHAIFDQVRSAAPNVCKDFCEDKLACEFPAADGDEEDKAFAAAIRRCTINCAWYMDEGAYVIEVEDPLEKKTYEDHVTGAMLEDMLKCSFYEGVFLCTEQESGEDLLMLNPLVQSMCIDADNCLSLLRIDQEMEWTPFTDGGGECIVSGDQTIESMFF